MTETQCTAYAFASPTVLTPHAIVDCAAVTSVCSHINQCVVAFSMPRGTIPPCQAAGGSLYEPTAVGIRFKLIQYTDGSCRLIRFFTKVVPGIPFELVSADSLNDAGLNISIIKGTCRLSALEDTSVSECRKVGGLHCLVELPLDFATIRRAIQQDIGEMRAELARHFKVHTDKLSRILAVGEDNDMLPTTLTEGMATATLFTATVDTATTASAPQQTATTPVTKTPVRQLKMTFGYPSTATISKLANIIDQRIDFAADRNQSDINMQANAKQKIYRPIGDLTKASFRGPGKTIIMDMLGEKHIPSVNGLKYCLTTMDAFTHLVDFQFLRGKTSIETYHRFKDSVMAMNLPIDTVGSHVNQDCTVHVDGAGSFKGHMEESLHHGGIRKLVADAYRKNTNLSHMVEYKNMQCQHKVRVWIAQCSQLWRHNGKTVFKHWPFFVKQSALAMNYQPSTWHDGRPAIEYKPGRTLGKVTKAEVDRMFPAPPGALCWCIYTQDKRDAMRSVAKADAWWPINHGGIKQWVRRSDRCFYLHTTDAGAYKILNVRTGKIWVTTNVKFSFEGLDTGFAGVQSPGDNIEDADWASLKSSVHAEDWRPRYEYSTFNWDDDDEEEEIVEVGRVHAPAQQPAQPIPAAGVDATPGTTMPTAVPAAPTSSTSGPATHLHATAAQQLFDNAAQPVAGPANPDQLQAEPPPLRRSTRAGGHASTRAAEAANVMTTGIRLPPSVILAAAAGGMSTFFYDNGEECTDLPRENEPTTLTQALKTDLSAEWQASWDRELGAVSQHLTKVRLKDWCRDHPGERPLHSTIVIKVKRTPDGKIDVFKSRLCCIGTNADPRYIGETSAQTPNRSTIDMFTALGVQLSWSTATSDAKTCFLQGDFFKGQAGKQLLRLPKSVREYDSEGYELAYQIDRPIYGLLDSSANWSRTQGEFFTSSECPIPLRQNDFDAAVHSLYLPHDRTKRRRALLQLKRYGITEDDVTTGKHVYHIASWVDDNRYWYTNDQMHHDVIAAYKKRFQATGGDTTMESGEPEDYLGNLYTFKPGAVTVTNQKMADKILTEAGMSDPSTFKLKYEAMDPKLNLPEAREQTQGEIAELKRIVNKEKWSTPETTYDEIKTRYRSMLMSISYLGQSLHKELQLTVSVLASHQNHVCITSYQALKHLLRYVAFIRKEGVTYTKTNTDRIVLSAESDASLGSSLPFHGGSRYGVLLRINDGPAFHTEIRRSQVTMISSHGAELFAMSQACRSIMYFRRFLASLGYRQGDPTVLRMDNSAARQTAEKRTNQQKSKHLCLRFLYVRDCVKSKDVSLLQTPSADLCIDVATKAQGGEAFHRNRWKLKNGVITPVPNYTKRTPSVLG